jgi:hypothetical protein
MAKLDYGALAKGVKLSSEKDKPGTEEADEGDDDAPGKLGTKAIAASKAGNGEAFEEAVRAICGQ